MANQTVEIVVETSRCHHIVSILSREAVLAVDCEGIALGVEGPMTLLQICTYSGDVYLFDVQENRDLFSEGHLKIVLESDETLKVMHACSYDSAALYHQFGVTLRNVFDTQVADTVLEEHKDRLLVKSLNLQTLCEKYSIHTKVSEYKEQLKAQYRKEEGDFWAKRPLTDQMKSVAVGDVRALIPEVFEKQKSFIDENGLLEIFQERVSETINYYIDDKIRTLRYRKRNNIVHQIIDSIKDKWDARTNFADIPKDTDEYEALKRIDYKEAAAKKSKFIDRLKTESIMSDLNELGKKIAKDERDYEVKWIQFSCLTNLSKHPNDTVSRPAKVLREKLRKIILKEMEGKYTIKTEVTHLTKSEMDALKSLNLQSYHDQELPENIRYLYWLLMEYDIEKNCKRLIKMGNEFKMQRVYYEKIQSYLKSGEDVPKTLKECARRFMRHIDKTFGRDHAHPSPFL